jgi:hypothetical protein
MFVTLFLLAGVGGIVFWNVIGGRFEGDRPERSLRIPIGRFCFHIHHWLYCLGLMALFYSWDAAGPGVAGFLSGSVVQGLTYRDWYLLVYDRGRGEEIYARWRPQPD